MSVNAQSYWSKNPAAGLPRVSWWYRPVSPGRLYLALIGLLLLGYAFLGKGFAYLGHEPVYIGEVAFLASLLLFLLGPKSVAVFRSPITRAVLAFVAWGAVNTVPYIGTYGLLALRDAVIWGYSLFALTLATVLLRHGLVERALKWYGSWTPWFFLWAPAALLLPALYPEALPQTPGTGVPLIVSKGGDIAVHLAGTAAFLALGLHRRFPRRNTVWFQEWIWWTLCGIALLAIGARSRGGLLALAMSLAVVVTFRSMHRIYKLGLIGTLVLTIFLAINPEIPVQNGREISAQQILRNAESIFLRSSAEELRGTVEWRLRWWRTIWDYTIFGDLFWTGKGYGVNLADSDGFQVIRDAAPLRSPHSSHMTVLARSGVPGLLLWLLVQVAVFTALFRAYRRLKGAGEAVRADVTIWLMAYLGAFIVNSSFDVFLEGPQGGVWFWCLIGFATAIERMTPRTASPTGSAYCAQRQIRENRLCGPERTIAGYRESLIDR